MELKNIFKNSSFDTLDQNKELLEEHDLLNIMGSPNKVFLKFLKAKDIDINQKAKGNHIHRAQGMDQHKRG